MILFIWLLTIIISAIIFRQIIIIEGGVRSYPDSFLVNIMIDGYGSIFLFLILMLIPFLNIVLTLIDFTLIVFMDLSIKDIEKTVKKVLFIKEFRLLKTYLFNIKFFAELSDDEVNTLWDELEAAVSYLVPDTYIDVRCEEC